MPRLRSALAFALLCSLVVLLLEPSADGQEAAPKKPAVKSQPAKPAAKPAPAKKPAAAPAKKPAEPGRLETEGEEAIEIAPLPTKSSVKSEPAKSETTKPEPVKSEPIKSEPVKTEAAKKSLQDEEEPLLGLTPAEPAKEPAAAPVGQAYLLRYKIQPKEQLRWEVIHQVDFDTTVSGTTQRAKTYSKSTKLWRVTEVKPDGSFAFNHMVEDSAMWQELTGRARVEWDSKKDSVVPSGFEAVAASLGKVLFHVEMDTLGKVLDRTIDHRGPGAANENDEEHFMTLPLPKEKVPVGYSWHLPFEIKLPQEGGGVKTFKAREKFVLTKVEDGIAVVSLETQLLTPVRDPAIEAQLIQRGGRGELKFDIARGRVISQQVDVDKSVLGFRGPASSIHYVSRFTERLVDGEKKTASREKKTAE